MSRIAFWGIEAAVLVIIIACVSFLLVKILRKNKGIGIAVITLLVILISYNIYDNNRIVVQQQIVYIQDLPSAFEDFKILQLTDLHGRTFGPGQAYLIGQVNAIDYDMIAVTGDMETASPSFSPFITLLDGIKNKANIFYVNGNEDLAYNSLTGVKTEAGKNLEDHGCILLTEPYVIQRAGKTLWLVNDVSAWLRTYYQIYDNQEVPGEDFDSPAQYQAYQAHLAKLAPIYAQIKNQGDIKMAVTHIPIMQSDLEQWTTKNHVLDYDLIIAGHYHGGQFRIPFYGALFIPVDAPFKDELFPDQRYVSGLVEYNGIQQYVSSGLGARLVPFRLFDTPEINLIILKAK